LKRTRDLSEACDALEFFGNLTPDTPETRCVGKQAWASLLLTEEMRKARKKAGLTQEQVAEKLGVTQGWVSRLEHADHDHTLESVVAYFDALGADLEFKVSWASEEGAGSEPS
jgi:DNA-binding XRE family transcriptional regulator